MAFDLEYTKMLKLSKLALIGFKFKIYVFYKPQKRVNIPKLTINNTNIERVDEFNYLGLMLNKHLNWKQHITKIANTISKTIGIINTLKYELPENTLLTIFNSLILTHFNYCMLAQGYDSKRIYKPQKKAIDIISKSKLHSHLDRIFKKLEILKIDDIHYMRDSIILSTSTVRTL